MECPERTRALFRFWNVSNAKADREEVLLMASALDKRGRTIAMQKYV